MNNLKESLDEIMLMREGKLPKTTWKEFREKLKSNTKWKVYAEIMKRRLYESKRIYTTT